MKRHQNRLFFGALVALLLVGILWAIQFQGPFSYASLPAPALKFSEPMADGAPSPKFAGSVGGVSFDQSARPHDNLIVNTLRIGYLPSSADGDRLNLTINDRPIKTKLADWLLIPLAHYADSGDYSCFTLFGKLNDADLQRKIEERKGRVMNYHPAFVNTLLGLRLFYLDILILYEHARFLPTYDDGSLLLGLGETDSDENTKSRALNAISLFLQSVQSELGYIHRSWILCDYTRDICFTAAGDSLTITGEPFYFFWRYKSDRSDYDQGAAERRIAAELEAESAAADDVRAWTFQKLLQVLRQYDADYPPAFYGTVDELLKLPSEEARLAMLEHYNHTGMVENLILPMLVYMDGQQVEYLKEYSERVSARTDLLERINPAVWKAATATLQYAALFRYCKANFPEEWQAFVAQIDDVQIKPVVETPTVMYRSDDAELSDLINREVNQR